MKRLLIVADHSLVVHAIRLALRQTAGFQLVGSVDGRRSARDAILEARPEVILVDDMQQREHALERLREVAEAAPEAKALLLTVDMGEAWLAEAFAAGATTAISKSVHPVALGTLLREVVDGHVVNRQSRRSDGAGADNGLAAAPDCPLTSRELEILRLTAQGLTNVQIAGQLWVTEQTVKFHLSNVYRKLAVANRTQATRYAFAHGLVPTALMPSEGIDDAVRRAA
jgi:DNA-binding NarL/FixJ family response regulator